MPKRTATELYPRSLATFGMSTIVRIGTHQLTAERVCQHLSTSQFLPQLLREIVIDEALAQWYAATQAQLALADIRVDEWDLSDRELALSEGINQPGAMVIATRAQRIEEFKQDVWGAKLGSYYLSRKSQQRSNYLFGDASRKSGAGSRIILSGAV